MTFDFFFDKEHLKNERNFFTCRTLAFEMSLIHKFALTICSIFKFLESLFHLPHSVRISLSKKPRLFYLVFHNKNFMIDCTFRNSSFWKQVETGRNTIALFYLLLLKEMLCCKDYKILPSGFTFHAYVNIAACSVHNFKGYVSSLKKNPSLSQGFVFFGFKNKLR